MGFIVSLIKDFKNGLEAADVAQMLIAITVLEEDLGLALGTTRVTQVLGNLISSFNLVLGTHVTQIHPLRYTHTYI